MKYIEMNKSIRELSDREIEYILQHGHLGSDTKRIPELWSFYQQIEEEWKRRELKKKELQKIFPIDTYWIIRADKNYLIHILSCVQISHKYKYHDKISDLCVIEGYEIFNGKLNIVKGSKLNKDSIFGWNRYQQEMIYFVPGKPGRIASFYECVKISKEEYDDIVKMFNFIGLNDINNQYEENTRSHM